MSSLPPSFLGSPMHDAPDAGGLPACMAGAKLLPYFLHLKVAVARGTSSRVMGTQNIETGVDGG